MYLFLVYGKTRDVGSGETCQYQTFCIPPTMWGRHGCPLQFGLQMNTRNLSRDITFTQLKEDFAKPTLRVCQWCLTALFSQKLAFYNNRMFLAACFNLFPQMACSRETVFRGACWCMCPTNLTSGTPGIWIHNIWEWNGTSTSEIWPCHSSACGNRLVD